MTREGCSNALEYRIELRGRRDEEMAWPPKLIFDKLSQGLIMWIHHDNQSITSNQIEYERAMPYAELQRQEARGLFWNIKRLQ